MAAMSALRHAQYCAAHTALWTAVRGMNENTNGLLRQVVPAGTRFSQVSRREIQRVQTILNDRP